MTPPPPPPDDNPLEEANVWCDILKLEGRKHSNLVAEGFVNHLKKSIDSTLYEVLNSQRFISQFNINYVFLSEPPQL